MDLKYVLVSCIMSLSIAGLLAITACRAKNAKGNTDIFSASLGIIIFVCVKSIFTDCNWGFAALFGVVSGFAAQIAMTLGSFLFFRELRASAINDKFGNITRDACLVCFGIGRNLICDYSALSDISLYLFGESVEFAVIILAVLILDKEPELRSEVGLIKSAAAIIAIKAAVCSVLRIRAGFNGEFAGIVMLTVGISGMVCEFVKALRQDRSISAGGFAAGFTAALCVTTLFG